ncbi:metal ABC transporter ATP-binding protein [Nostocoides veronense]|uniref:Metal ABC transporter ATP-binding protein n=1 Tax=Nostocoides veronense TaxID=330836 RepID=A0ABP4Y1I8_9MICO
MPPVTIIDLQDAAFGHAGTPIVSGVTVSIAPGEVVAVLGPNGAGKSTLVKGLLGLTEHLGGRANVLDQPLEEVDRRRIGYVPQRHTLANSVRATVAEIVAIGRLPYRAWWRPWRRDAYADRQAIARALEVVGLGERAGADVSALSGGQQRRVLIARALAASPDVLIMDEPTAGVDHANQLILAGVLETLAARGTTMLIVTHELQALADVITRVLVVDEGTISWDGSPADFTTMTGAPMDGHHHGHSPEHRSTPGHLPTDTFDHGSPHA